MMLGRIFVFVFLTVVCSGWRVASAQDQGIFLSVPSNGLTDQRLAPTTDGAKKAVKSVKKGAKNAPRTPRKVSKKTKKRP